MSSSSRRSGRSPDSSPSCSFGRSWQHVAEENTLATLKARLMYATKTFGDVRLDRLHVPELAAWRKRLPRGSAWHITKALRQVLH